MKEEALKQRDEMVSCLLDELVKVRQSLAESEDTIRSLKGKIEELEEDKKTLRETTPDNSVAHLQDELIASKLREAEASLSLKDLKQRVQELNSQWQRHLQVITFCESRLIKFEIYEKNNILQRSREMTVCKLQIQRQKNYYFGILLNRMSNRN